MFKRWALFILTNILVMVTISVILSILGVTSGVRGGVLDLRSLAIFCLVWGMVGSFISLALSRKMAKWMAGVEVVNPVNAGEFRWLVDTIHTLSKRAGLPALPEVGVYQSPEINAFATGPTKSRSLVAVSTGLLQQMTHAEIEGVLAHEVAHIQNGDMVTMTLIQGVINAFTMFLSRIAAFAISQNVEEERRALVQTLCTIAFDILLGLLGLVVVNWFSRQREFRADRGSAKLLGGRERMVAALNRLKSLHGEVASQGRDALAAYKISGKESTFNLIFATHPSLDSRIAALGRV